VAADLAPSNNGKQYAVTALGGTQTGVVVSSVANPFTLTTFKPSVLVQAPPVNAAGLFTGPVGRNVFSVITRKGLIPLAGQSPIVGIIETKISLPAGCTDADTNSVAALVSAHIGALSNQSTDIVTMCKSGVVTF
jgi:hypothetical protein